MVSRFRGVAVALVIGLLAAACGGQPAAPAKPAAQPSPPAAQPAAPKAAAPAPAPTPAPTQAAKAAPAPAKLEKTAIKLGVSTKDIPFFPIFVADAKNFWEKEGLKVETVYFGGAKAQIQALVSDSVDLVAGGVTDPIDTYISKMDIKAFWSQCNYPQFDWYGKKGLKSAQELKGRIAGTSGPGTFPEFITRWALTKVGLQADDMKYVRVGGSAQRIAALRAGQIDMTPLTMPYTLMLDDEGYPQLLRLKDHLPEFQCEVFFTKTPFLDKNPETLRAFTRAYVRTVQWAKANQAETTKIVMDFLGAKAEEMKYYEATVKEMLPYFPEDGHYALDAIKVLFDIYVSEKLLTAHPPMDAILDSRFVNFFKANPVR